MRTYSDNLVLSTSREVSSIRTEANASDIQITILTRVRILQMTDLLAGINVEDLRAAIAPGRHILTIIAEANTAHNTLVGKVVNQLNVKRAALAGVEDSMPIFTLALEMWWELIGFEVGELVTDLVELGASVLEVRRDLRVRVWWRGVACESAVGRTWIRVGLCLMGSGGSA